MRYTKDGLPILDFAVKDLKASDDAPGKFAGRASVYGVVDSYADVVMPGAFTKTLQENAGEIVVLNQHDSHDSIGLAQLEDGPDGLHCLGSLELDLQSAKDAYTRIKKKLVTGISIGYQAIKEDYINGVRRLLEIRLFEISLVTFPANEFARVTAVKSAIELAQQTQRLVSELKVGKVLSASNRKRVMDAYEAMSAALSPLKELLEATADPADEGDKSTATPAPGEAGAGAGKQSALEPQADLHSLVALFKDMSDTLCVRTH